MRYFRDFDTSTQLKNYLSGSDLWLPTVSFVKGGWTYKRAPKDVSAGDTTIEGYNAPDYTGISWATGAKDPSWGIPTDANAPFVYYEALDDGFSWVKTANETLYFWDRVYVDKATGSEQRTFTCTVDNSTGELNIDTSPGTYAVLDSSTGTLNFYNMGKLPDGSDSTNGVPNYVVVNS